MSNHKAPKRRAKKSAIFGKKRSPWITQAMETMIELVPASSIARIKASVRFSVAVLAVMLLAGCSNAPDEILRQDRLFRDEAVLTSEAISDYDALLFKSEGDEIYGQILKPDSSFGENRPCVLMIHGFAGFARFDDIGQSLCRAGCVVLIPHHRGAWGSQGKYSISNCVQDVVNLVNHIRSPEFLAKYHIDSSAVFLVGHSMGGNTVLNAAVQVPGVRGLIMLAPCDIGTMFQQMSKDEMRSFMVDNGLEVLRTDGFDAVYHDLAEHASAYAFPNAAAKLKNVNLFLAIGEWDTCISNDLLKDFYFTAQKNQSLPSCSLKNYKSKHGLMGVRTQLSRDIADFMLNALK